MARAVRRAQEPRDDAPTSRRTQVERRDEAERRILEAAALIVAENGLEAITLAEAGARAGYSRGLPSHYFKTKADLLSALGAYIIDSFMVVVFGGVGNLWGTLVGAFTLGIANKFLEPVAGAVLGKIAILVLIILFIQKRPRGLFALKGRAVEA